MRSKPVRRLYIPVKEHPEYNFIGLVIGPRGNTQKRLEKETGCKISVRGKGSLKDGSKGRENQPDADDELHVHITGDDEDKVLLAEKLVQELLQPIDDDKNEHKQKQLRELVQYASLDITDVIINAFSHSHPLSFSGFDQRNPQGR